MKISMLFGLPLLALASAVAIPNEMEERAKCSLTAKWRDQWTEKALTRYRVKFSTVGVEPQTFCDSFYKGTAHCFSAVSNLQCGFDSGVDGGSWRVDFSAGQGTLGHNQYVNCMQEAANQWRADHPCDVFSSW
ncbi:uncharacterized protein BP5553_09572 [Venustampulla echinocandica]|uniref:Uncharacterized protein n=1 Tax=Venustampulla echinocandica TaxID=2656787 RepID=A0A370TBE1_9HELO|nr:uncharacterized protein BP5553_09572 [Venustampulla echinocandica]RDL31363.1 hypothetical protein BP5553_09572 [Venustampulla echinocandica]